MQRSWSSCRCGRRTFFHLVPLLKICDCRAPFCSSKASPSRRSNTALFIKIMHIRWWRMKTLLCVLIVLLPERNSLDRRHKRRYSPENVRLKEVPKILLSYSTSSLRITDKTRKILCEGSKMLIILFTGQNSYIRRANEKKNKGSFFSFTSS